MNVVVAPRYEHLRDKIVALPALMARGEGEVLFNGRNKIVRFNPSVDCDIVVKRYKRHDIFKRVAYTFFRHDKARRSFDNARLLRSRGFDTPREVAYIEQKSAGLITQVYYVCAYTTGEAVRGQLIDSKPFNQRLAEAYACFVASLHSAGVLHRDLNPTNVLFAVDGEGGYRFELIDINRMRFYNGAVPKKECMENLTLFWWLTDVYRFVLDKYAIVRGWTQEDIARAVSVKQRHDRSWVRRKRFTGFLKKYILGK